MTPRLLVAVAALAVAQCSCASQTRTPPSAPPVVLGVSIEGNRLIDRSGNPLRLLGVNRSGAEYACVDGYGVIDGPTDDRSISAMTSWNINAVRLPLNEACWLGHLGLQPAYSGATYRSTIAAYVDALHRAGLIVVLDLHWSAPGTDIPRKSPLMPDADNALKFWRSVAATFKGDPAVVFELFNEPRDVDWKCWRDGCATAFGWQAAGMQSLVDAVRGEGAKQVILVPGLDFGNDLSQWISYRPDDPAQQLGASFHVYEGTACNTIGCWSAHVSPVAERVPVVTTELGQTDCGHAFTDAYMDWADGSGVSYLGWSWNPYGCSEQPALIASYGGEPTPYGVGLRDHLATLTSPRRAPRP